jgi:hypothetical protein
MRFSGMKVRRRQPPSGRALQQQTRGVSGSRVAKGPAYAVSAQDVGLGRVQSDQWRMNPMVVNTEAQGEIEGTERKVSSHFESFALHRVPVALLGMPPARSVSPRECYSPSSATAKALYCTISTQPPSESFLKNCKVHLHVVMPPFSKSWVRGTYRYSWHRLFGGRRTA